MDERPTHLDLFSGVAGFAVAAQWAGFRTVGFCEVEPRCRAFIEKAWGIAVEPDIRKLDGRKYAGVSLISGGPPCQPASRAGKQRGAEDDRWLWGEALRVLAEAQPFAVVFENPPGIGDVGLDGILSEMGRIGYEVGTFDIPACAVDSPQLRHRFWIVGFRLSDSARIGCGEVGAESAATRRTSTGDDSSAMADTAARQNDFGGNGDVAEAEGCGRSSDTASRGDCEKHLEESISERGCCREMEAGRRAWDAGNVGPSDESPWANSVWVPCADGKLRRAPDDSFGLVDGLHRSLLAALGNSINPYVAYQILAPIAQLIKAERSVE